MTARVDQVPIPDLMRRLPRDARGYPIPVIVQRDIDGRPHFAINNEPVRQRMMRADRCTICGQPLHRFRWMVGGPISAFDEHGAYSDPPLHKDCAHYALQVCPYLAAPRYLKRIDGKTVDPEKMPEARLGFYNPTQPELAARPDFFAAVMTTGQRYTDHENYPPGTILGFVIPQRPYRAIEFWEHGRQVPWDDPRLEPYIATIEAGKLLAGERPWARAKVAS